MHSVKYLLVLQSEFPKKQPPPGYDAVIGEPGGDLNYDECIGTCKKLVAAWLLALIQTQFIK
jgi:hypothetical protein